jgi:hypothetical protein
MQYIYVAIGEGRIRQSDVLFAFDKNFRRNVESCLSKGKDLQEWELIPAITKTDSRYDSGDISIYLSYRNLRIYAGELYEFITDLERVLHEKIKSVVVQEFGEEESGWWRQGVPERIRSECAQTRERDPEFADDPYNYCTFIHLTEVVDKNWILFQGCLPADLVADKKTLLTDLRRLNAIRNRVMHPVRSTPPSEDDFEFVREMRKKLHESCWRPCITHSSHSSHS